MPPPLGVLFFPHWKVLTLTLVLVLTFRSLYAIRPLFFSLSIALEFAGIGFCRLTLAPVSPCFHPHSVAAFAAVPVGVLNSRGAAISIAT